MRQAVIYLRVSTIDQTTANQERELREIASRMGCEIVKVYRDHGISGAKGRDKRPAFDKLCRDAASSRRHSHGFRFNREIWRLASDSGHFRPARRTGRPCPGKLEDAANRLSRDSVGRS